MLWRPLDFPLNPELTGALIEAAQLARGREIDDSVFACALVRIGSVSHALAESGADVAQLKVNLRRIVDGLPKRPWYRIDLSLTKPIHRAVEKAQRAGLDELSGPFAFAILAERPDNRALPDALGSAGFSLLAFRRYVAHGVVPRDTSPLRGPVRVIIHDDPFTPMDFVVHALEQVFGRDAETSRALMMRVHREGSAALASMDAEEANRLVRLFTELATSQGFPLRASLQEVG